MKSAQSADETARPPGGRYAGKAASTRQEERRKKLLAAGIRLMGRQGYAATSIDAVCSEAGLTKRYFYESFASSEALLVESFRVVTREFLTSIMHATAPHLGNSRTLVRAGLEQTFGYVRQHPDEARLIMIEATSVRSQLGTLYGSSYDEFVKLLVGFTKPFLPGKGPGDAILAAQAMGADLAYIGSAFIATHEARAPEAYKQAIVEGSSDDIVYSSLFTGVHGNYLRGSIVNAGLDPENLAVSDASKMNFSGGESKKAWKDIWGCGQGIGHIKQVLPAREVVARLAAEYQAARQRLALG